MLTASLGLRRLAAKPATMACFNFYVSPRLLASSRTFSSQTRFKTSFPRGLHNCGFSYLRPSISNLAISSVPRAQIQRLRFFTRVVHIRLRPDVATTAPRAEQPHATSPANTSTAAIPPSGSRDKDAVLLGKRSTSSKMMGGPSGDKLSSAASHGLLLGFVTTLLTAIFLLHASNFLELSHNDHEWLKRICQEMGIYQQGEARTEDELNASRGVWSKLVNVLGYVAYPWDNDPAWYSGSILSKIMPVFRDVSLYTAAILLAVYMISIFQTNRDKNPQLVIQGSPSVLISTASRKR